MEEMALTIVYFLSLVEDIEAGLISKINRNQRIPVNQVKDELKQA